MGRGNKIKKIICLLTILTVVSSCITVHATELEGSKEDIDARSTEVNEISVETKSEIEDTEAGMQEETETPEVVGFTPKLVDFSLSKNTISLKYHDYVTYNVIGKSERGKNIYDIVLGNPNADRTVLVVCTLYAREYVTSVMAMK